MCASLQGRSIIMIYLFICWFFGPVLVRVRAVEILHTLVRVRAVEILHTLVRVRAVEMHTLVRVRAVEMQLRCILSAACKHGVLRVGSGQGG